MSTVIEMRLEGAEKAIQILHNDNKELVVALEESKKEVELLSGFLYVAKGELADIKAKNEREKKR